MNRLLERQLEHRVAPDRSDRTPDVMGGFAKGLAVIEAFDRDREKLTISDVSRLTGLDRATARRCLLTLVAGGYASSDGKRFSLTGRVLRLGYAYLAATPLPRLVQPYLEQLSETTQESCSASILDHDEIVYIARSAQRRVMSIGLNVGSRLPAYCTSMGRVLLAALPPSESAAILGTAKLERLTPHTVTAVSELIRILATVRAQGYCINDQELELGLRSIAIPIIDKDHRVIAALNIGVQAGRVSTDHLINTFLPAMSAIQSELRELLP